MGLLDNLLGSVLGNGPAASLVENFVQQHGGVAGVVQQLQASGLGAHAQSWVGNGANLPISVDQLSQVFGSSPALQQLAQQAGIDPQAVLGHLSQLLPQAINQATPGGVIPGQ